MKRSGLLAARGRAPYHYLVDRNRSKVRFAHVNLIAEDWRRLAGFYETVFGFVPVPPERDQHGAWLEDATGLPGAHIRGVHLRLPNDAPEGPTIEIYGYSEMPERPAIQLNTPGFSHVAFSTEDVEALAERVIAEGGQTVGRLTEVEVPGAGKLIFQYVSDREGNLIELQTWS